MSLPPVEETRHRLESIFPEGVADRSRLTRELAAKTILTFLFVRAVGSPDDAGTPLLRPSMVTWMDDQSLARADDREFAAEWHAAARRGQAPLRTFLEGRGIDWRRWYAENSREPIRDEIIRPLYERYGAVLRRHGVAPSDASPALTLAGDFASLFDPEIEARELSERIARWQEGHLNAAEQARLAALRRLDTHTDTRMVTLPGRGSRALPPGQSSAVTAAVVTELAPRLLARPYVLAICHPGDPVASEDARELERVGLVLEPELALPDVLLLDAADATICFVEVVVSGGPMHDRRRQDLLAWAERHAISAARCSFVTAYRSRSDRIFRSTVGELAWQTLVWFADEPDNVFRLDELRPPARP